MTTAADFIVIPTYDERGNIRTLVEKIFALYPGITVLVVDDNSPDGTAGVVRELQKSYPTLHLKERAGKLGLASAYLGAFKDILREQAGVRAIITMDADLSHDPTTVAVMLRKIETHDLVVGSRYIQGGGVQNWSWRRRALSRLGNIYARWVTWSSVHDLTGGFNCYSAALLRRYDFSALKATGYAYQMEMKIEAARIGARIVEVPIIFPDRTAGYSKMSGNIIREGLILPWRFSPLASLFGKRHL